MRQPKSHYSMGERLSWCINCASGKAECQEASLSHEKHDRPRGAGIAV